MAKGWEMVVGLCGVEEGERGREVIDGTGQGPAGSRARERGCELRVRVRSRQRTVDQACKISERRKLIVQ